MYIKNSKQTDTNMRNTLCRIFEMIPIYIIKTRMLFVCLFVCVGVCFLHGL